MWDPHAQPRLFVRGALAVIGLLTADYSSGLRAQSSLLATPVVLCSQANAPAPAYQGPGRCKQCHDSNQKNDWVSMKESAIWQAHDKHAQAYELLNSPLGKAMGKRLQGALGWTDDLVATKRECLSCHANWHGKHDPQPADVARLFLKDGVSCESCHGPGAEYDRPHSEASWRTKTAAEKLALGMVEVRDPVARAEQCLTCHIGDRIQGKVLTHEMYAAGHPPLPGIEVETFAFKMPRHWRTLNEKPEALENLAAIRTLHKQPAGELHRTRSVLVGSVAALRVSVEQFAREADVALQENKVLDFAQFDCFQCHHELQSRSWRQLRPIEGRPGRPQIRAWPAALAAIAVRHAHRDQPGRADAELKSFHSQLAALRQAVAARPFGDLRAIGDPADPSSTSGQFVVYLKNLEQLLQTSDVKYDRAASIRLLRDISQVVDDEIVDYDSARQLAWAATTIYQELQSPPPPAGQEPYESRPEAFKRLASQFHLDLPWTRTKSIAEDLPIALRVRSEYDPLQFRQAIDELKPLFDRIETSR